MSKPKYGPMRLPSRDPIEGVSLHAQFALSKPRPKHDHRQSYWLLGNGAYRWCYRCGAVQLEKGKWVKPTGPDGENPAMSNFGRKKP